ncbi:hypothetical protein bcgnr5380_59380 [Bacillus cereus]
MARSAALCPESYPLPRSDQAQVRRLVGISLAPLCLVALTNERTGGRTQTPVGDRNKRSVPRTSLRKIARNGALPKDAG